VLDRSIGCTKIAPNKLQAVQMTGRSEVRNRSLCHIHNVDRLARRIGPTTSVVAEHGSGGRGVLSAVVFGREGRPVTISRAWIE
jgi:hypothetical protein